MAVRVSPAAFLPVRVLAIQAAKNAVKNQIRAQGLRIWDFTAKDIAIRAEAWLAAHPELIVEARAKAARLGYALP
jgi:hypothetical protein